MNAETWQALGEYDSFLGPQIEATIYDWTIRRWRKCKMQPLRTPKDGPPPIDPDAMIDTDETHVFGEAEGQRLLSRQDITERRHARADAVMQAYLAEHGPSTLADLLPLSGWKGADTLRAHLYRQPDKYVRLNEKPAVFGLPGQSLAEATSKNVPTHIVAEALLTKYGPATVAELAQRSGLHDSTMATALRRFEGDRFVVVVGTGDRISPNGMIATVWGMMGIHDGEAA